MGSEAAESQDPTRLTDDEKKLYEELEDREFADGTRWNFKKPIHEIADFIERSKPGSSREQYLSTASNAVATVWRRALKDEKPDFSYLKELGASDESIIELQALIKKYRQE